MAIHAVSALKQACSVGPRSKCCCSVIQPRDRFPRTYACISGVRAYIHSCTKYMRTDIHSDAWAHTRTRSHRQIPTLDTGTGTDTQTHRHTDIDIDIDTDPDTHRDRQGERERERDRQRERGERERERQRKIHSDPCSPARSIQRQAVVSSAV